MGEQLGTGKTPEMLPEELPPLQEENSEITNLNNGTHSAESRKEREKWSMFRACETWGKRRFGICEKKSGRNLLVEQQLISCLQEIQGSVENKLPLEIQQPPPGTPKNLPDTAEQ